MWLGCSSQTKEIGWSGGLLKCRKLQIDHGQVIFDCSTFGGSDAFPVWFAKTWEVLWNRTTTIGIIASHYIVITACDHTRMEILSILSQASLLDVVVFSHWLCRHLAMALSTVWPYQFCLGRASCRACCYCMKHGCTPGGCVGSTSWTGQG